MKRLIILSIALLASIDLSKAQNQNLNTPKLDSLFSAIETYGKGMGSVSIFQNGKEIYKTSYGYADMEPPVDCFRVTVYSFSDWTNVVFTVTFSAGIEKAAELL